MRIYVIVAVWRGIVDSVECYLEEDNANYRLKEAKAEHDQDDYDYSLHLVKL